MPYAFKHDNKSTDTEYEWGGDFEVSEHCPSIDHFLSEKLEWVYNPLAHCYRMRKNAYGSLESQLDEIFHNGVDSWRAHIESVKLQYPKPS